MKVSGNVYTWQWILTWAFLPGIRDFYATAGFSFFVCNNSEKTVWTCIATFRFLIIQFAVVKGNFQLIFISRPWDGSLIVNAGFRLMRMQIWVICFLILPQSTFRQHADIPVQQGRHSHYVACLYGTRRDWRPSSQQEWLLSRITTYDFTIVPVCLRFMTSTVRSGFNQRPGSSSKQHMTAFTAEISYMIINYF